MSRLLDADVFIQAKNMYYGFDIVPAFWDWLIAANIAGEVYSIEKVAEELVGYADELAEWAKERVRVGGFFLPPDDAVTNSLRQVATWANGQNFTEGAVNDFLQKADFYLVAHAHAHGHTVVTMETFQADVISRIKIPNACAGMGVPYENTWEMLRAQGIQFGS